MPSSFPVIRHPPTRPSWAYWPSSLSRLGAIKLSTSRLRMSAIAWITAGVTFAADRVSHRNTSPFWNSQPRSGRRSASPLAVSPTRLLAAVRAFESRLHLRSGTSPSIAATGSSASGGAPWAASHSKSALSQRAVIFSSSSSFNSCVVQKTLALVRLGDQFCDQPIAVVVIHACATAPTPAAAPANRGDDPPFAVAGVSPHRRAFCKAFSADSGRS